MTGIGRRLAQLVDAQCAAGAPSCILRVDAPAAGRWELAAGVVSHTDRRPVRPDTPFRTASITKAFTAVVVAQLADESLLDLDDPVSTHLAHDVTELLDALLVVDGRSYGRQVTVRQLLEHSSGLGDHASAPGFHSLLGEDPGRRWAPRELLAVAKRVAPPAAVPGEGTFTYSDTGYVVIGTMIETLCGRPLHEELRRRILEPLGLVHTWLEGYDTPRSTPLSHAYHGPDDTMVIHGSADWAAGGLVSTAADLERFVRAVVAGELLSPGAVAELLRAEPGRIGAHDGRHGLVGYGLGIEARQLGGRCVRGHLGMWGAFMYVDPETTTTFTGTVNRSDHPLHDFLSDVICTVGQRSERGERARSRHTGPRSPSSWPGRLRIW